MSNTAIQIKRSTSTSAPPNLAAGELAFTSNGDTLWIGSPSGSNTANVVHIGAKISYLGNSTQIGSSLNGSNSELASTFAIKGYVDGRLGAFSTNLAGLTDVNVTGAANNNLLIYNATTSKWEDHTIGGTANEVEVTFNNNDIVVGLPNTVTMNTISVTGNTVMSGTINVTGEAHFFEVIHINRDTPAHIVHFISNPTLIATVNTNSFGQIAMQNFNGGANSSADIVAYPNNTRIDDNTGFIDMGITGNGYNQAAFAVTGPNDGYIFVSARSGDSLGGSMVLATDSTGTNNDIKFFAGGFTFNANAPHMVLTGSNRNFGINNANPTSRLSVGGGAFIDGNIETQNVLPLANNTYSLGNTTNRFQSVFANNITGLTGTFTQIGGTLLTANQPNITNVGTLNSVTVTNTTTLNGNVVVGSNTSDVISVNGLVNTNIVASANVTYDLGTSASSWRNVYAGNGYFNDVTVTGNLVVQGVLTTIDTNELVVEDPLIRLARNQSNTATFTDAVDIGFYGVYGNTSSAIYTGLARDASTNTYVLFDGLSQVPDNVVNTAAITVTTLTAYLNSGALSTNATSLTITANSTVNVNITANSLTLNTSLTVGSGGTGRNSLTNNAIMVGNTTGAITLVSSSTEGHVLQINASGAPEFGGLDGGTF